MVGMGAGVWGSEAQSRGTLAINRFFRLSLPCNQRTAMDHIPRYLEDGEGHTVGAMTRTYEVHVNGRDICGKTGSATLKIFVKGKARGRDLFHRGL